MSNGYFGDMIPRTPCSCIDFTQRHTVQLVHRIWQYVVFRPQHKAVLRLIHGQPAYSLKIFMWMASYQEQVKPRKEYKTIRNSSPRYHNIENDIKQFYWATELRSQPFNLTAICTFGLLTKFSNVPRLYRVVSFMYPFVHNCRHSSERRMRSLKTQEACKTRGNVNQESTIHRAVSDVWPSHPSY